MNFLLQDLPRLNKLIPENFKSSKKLHQFIQEGVINPEGFCLLF